MDTKITVLIMLIGILSTLCQLLGWWFRIPSILFLLITGAFLGPLTGFFNPDKLFGDLMFPVISLAVSVILFEGSLTLKFNEISDQKNYFLKFIGVGGLITWFGVAITAHIVLGVNWSLCALIGAILVVTGPTVIGPMLQAVRPHNNVAQMLRWEGIILDPLGALLAVLVFNFIISEQSQGLWLHSLIYFIKMFLTGAFIGLASGFLLSELILRYLLPKFLTNIVVLNSVLAIFVLANICYSETGLLAVTVMGLTITNRKNIDLTSILDFKETLSTLLISSLFIILAARLDFSSLEPMLIPSLIIFTIMQFIIRPFKVMTTTIGSNLDVSHKVLLSWIAPRGIIAAAIASLFEIKLREIGYNHIEFITPLIFLIIVYSVLLPSCTARFLAKFLKVSDPEPNGILIIGANVLARAIAGVLKKHGVSVVLADSSWEDISAARLEGLATYYGNPVSEHADFNLNLIGLGKLLAITSNIDLGTIAGLRFSTEFGKKNIYYLQTKQEQMSHDKYLVSKHQRGFMLFDDNITYETLSLILQQGGEIRSTILSEQFDYEAYLNINTHHFILLFAFDPKNKLYVFAKGHSVIPAVGWTIVAAHKKKINSS